MDKNYFLRWCIIIGLIPGSDNAWYRTALTIIHIIIMQLLYILQIWDYIEYLYNFNSKMQMSIELNHSIILITKPLFILLTFPIIRINLIQQHAFRKMIANFKAIDAILDSENIKLKEYGKFKLVVAHIIIVVFAYNIIRYENNPMLIKIWKTWCNYIENMFFLLLLSIFDHLKQYYNFFYMLITKETNCASQSITNVQNSNESKNVKLLNLLQMREALNDIITYLNSTFGFYIFIYTICAFTILLCNMMVCIYWGYLFETNQIIIQIISDAINIVSTFFYLTFM